MKYFLLALLSGILLALGWPTYGFPLLIFFGFVPLLVVEFQLRTSNQKNIGWKVFGLSYLTFFIWNIITTYWLYFSTPFGMWFAVLVNALLMSLVFLIYHKIAKKIDFLPASIFLISLWLCFEKLHLNWDFSWPWLNLGNGFSEYYQWIQWYEYTGTFGGSLWIWVTNISIAKTVLLFLKYKDKSLIYRGLIKNALLIGIPIALSYFIFISVEEEAEKIEVVILQPNINPYTEKYHTNDRKIGSLLQKLSKEKITDSTKLILAPETVFANGTHLKEFENSSAVFSAEEIILEANNANFIGGISMIDFFRGENQATPQSNYYKEDIWYNDYNSAFLVNQQKETEFYHKSKLVVGVENFPYSSILKPLLGDAMIDLGGTNGVKTTQLDREVFQLSSGEQIAPIICYESVYGEYVTGYVRNGAELLAIITNDAWWGNTQGHQQHLSYARLRAIETRRNVVRSANTGISAFINSKGEVTQTLGYEKQGALIDKASLNNKKTFYVKYGDLLARIVQFVAIAIFIIAVTRRKEAVGKN